MVECEVTTFVELMLAQAGPLAVNLAAFNRATEGKHGIGVAVVGAAVAVFASGAAEFRHGQHGDVRHALAHVLVERRERVAEILQAIGELAGHPTFRHVVVPSAHFGKGHFQAGIGFDELRDLLQTPPRGPRGYSAPFSGW